MLSATVAVLLGSTLVVLIVVATGQRDASRVALRSQQALALSRSLQTSLETVEKDRRAYIEQKSERSKEELLDTLRSYPAKQRRLTGLISDDPAQLARVRQIGEKISSYTLRSSALITLTDTDQEAAINQLSYDSGDTKSRNDDAAAASLSRDLRELASGVSSRERINVVRRQHDAEAQSQLAIGFGVGGLVLVLVVVAGGTLYLRRKVVRPVVDVARATGRLADGDLSTRVVINREDEIGQLARGFNSMADSLERGRAQLEHSNAELTRSNGELEQFASVTSHDLQAPLTTISMYAELLDRQHAAGEGKGEELIDGIRGATRQARTLIADLLDYSRAGRGELSVEALHVAPVVEQALEALAGAIESSGAQVWVGSMPAVLADRSNLCRVFQNLISNAVKFTRGEHPEVCVEARQDGASWRFDVSDNGIGMDPQNARRIFEPFRRLHGEEDYPGTGIGLAVCARIVEQHGGRIWVSSTHGEGSVFSFTMPATPADAVASDAACRLPVGAEV